CSAACAVRATNPGTSGAAASREERFRKSRRLNMARLQEYEPQSHREHRDKTHREIRRTGQKHPVPPSQLYFVFSLLLSSVASVSLWFVPLNTIETRAVSSARTVRRAGGARRCNSPASPHRRRRSTSGPLRCGGRRAAAGRSSTPPPCPPRGSAPCGPM